jgi:hypothetical protein
VKTSIPAGWLALALAMPLQAAPVTGWIAVNPQSGAASTKPLSGALTDSPVLGNGTEDSAAMVGLYADISGPHDGAADVALANGEEVTLTGSATLTGITSSMEQFRWGLFNEFAAPFDAVAWRGYIASNSAGFSGGALRAKDAEPTTTFAQSGSAVTVATSQDGDSLVDETYYFSMSVARFNNELSIDASLTTADDWSQVWSDVAVAAPLPVTFDFNRVGFLSGSGMRANQVSFANIDVATQPIDTLTLQVTTTGPQAGAVQIRNLQPGAFEIEYYEITSAAGSLDLDGWNSLDDQEMGDPPLQGWDEAAGSDANLLSELRLADATSVSAATSLTLGQAFAVGGAQDLSFYVGLADGTLVRGVVEYVLGGLAGDFNDDNLVDAADYVVWRKNFGTSNSLPNDPTGGPIGAAQYNLWRANFGDSSSPSASHASSAAPEPQPTTLAAIAILAWLCTSPLRINPKTSVGYRRVRC